MYTTEERAGASGTGGDGALRLAAAADMLQDCELFWLESEPALAGFMRENGLGMFLTSRQIDVIRLPSYGERVRIRTGIFGCRGFYGYRNTAMYGEDGAPCLLTWSTGAFVHMGEGGLARIPAAVTDRVARDDKLDMDYLDRKIAPPGGGIPLPPYPVRRNDIDFYRHMNNARYLELALELLPDGFVFDRVRAEYKSSAKLGDALYPVMFGGGGGKRTVALNGGQGETCAVMEFSRR